MGNTFVFFAGPAITAAFAALMFGVLQHQAHRHGFSLMKDMKHLGSVGLSVAGYVVLAASLFSGVVLNALLTPQNIPPDWSPLFIYGLIFVGLGLTLFELARRQVLRGVARDKPPSGNSSP